MSAPLSGPASGSPTPGYYPDPSIPGYIRYWNGDAWVPGTSRPEPRNGEPMPAPPGEAASATSPPTAAEPAPAEETGTFRAEGSSGAARSGSAWQADAARQGGTGEGAGAPLSWAQGAQRGSTESEPFGRGGENVPEGTVQMRAMKPGGPTSPAEEGGSVGGFPDHTVGLRRSDLPRQANVRPEQPAPGQRPVQPLPGRHPAPAEQPGQAAQDTPPSWAAQAHVPAQHAPVQEPSGGQTGTAQSPLPGPEGVIPWRPPVSDPFLAAAQQQARPAGLGKRLGARAVDGLITSAVVGAATFPLVNSGVEHIEQKMEAVRQSGETEQVWLIDGTTGGHLAVVLAVLILFGLVYEVLPTVRWGRTLGKKLFGLQVLDVEQQSTPGFGPSAVRWLVQSGLWLVVVGVVNVVWALFDRPWHQCWHDKLAHTFVAKEEGGVSL